MIRLVCLLEERSADEMLKIILPKILPENIQLEKSIIFEGKQDLERNLIKKLRYWNKSKTLFLLMRDQDSGDCKYLKNSLKIKVNKSGQEQSTLIRIACRELESFYLGDLNAVELGLNIKSIKKQQSKSKFRNPDKLNNAKQELLKLTANGYQPILGSRSIASYMDLNGINKSESFNVLISGVRSLISRKA